MQRKSVSVGQVGLGYWGRNIFRNLSEMRVLSVACDTQPDVLENFRQSAGTTVKLTASIDEVLLDPAVSAVVISTPASTHFQLTRQALEVGKHVFVEKPMALSAQEGEELVALAQVKKRTLMVGHILQYHPAIEQLRGLIKDGTLGKIQYIYSNRLNIGKLRTEENILWSFAPHDISVILSLIGEEPTVVTASGGDYLTRDVFDITLSTLTFKTGIRGHIFVSWLNPFKEQKLVLVGSRQMAVFNDQSEHQLILYPHEIEWRDGKNPIAQKADGVPIPFPRAEPLKRELEHFINCVKTGEQPRTDGREGLQVLRVLERLERSLASNGLPS